MSNNINNSNANDNINDNMPNSTWHWITDALDTIYKYLEKIESPKTHQDIRQMAEALPEELVELLWTSTSIDSRASLVANTASWMELRSGRMSDLDASWMLRAAIDDEVAKHDKRWFNAAKIREAILRKALAWPTMFVAKHHHWFTDPKIAYKECCKYSTLLDRRILVLGHILGVAV